MDITCFLLDKIRIAARSAGADDGSFTCNMDFISVLVCRQDACYLSVLHDDLLRRSFQKHLHTQLLGPCVQCLVHKGSGSRSDAGVSLYDMPGRL